MRSCPQNGITKKALLKEARISITQLLLTSVVIVKFSLIKLLQEGNRMKKNFQLKRKRRRKTWSNLNNLSILKTILSNLLKLRNKNSNNSLSRREKVF